VVGAIEPRLRQSEIERATRKPTNRLDAYDLYLRALEQFHKFTDESMREAIALLGRALDIDPSYAPAAAMFGWCRDMRRIQGWEQVSDAEVAESVDRARQAIALGRENPEALWMSAHTLAVFAGEHATAASMIERALALNPNSANAWMVSGWLSCYRNQPE